MNYPGLATSLRNQLTESEWNVVGENVAKVDNLAWHQNEQACKLQEDAAKKAVDRNYYRCAARVLYYYNHFFAAA